MVDVTHDSDHWCARQDFGVDMLGAVATAGRVDGGPHLVVPPVLALLCLVLVARGGGRWQLLDRLDPPR